MKLINIINAYAVTDILAQAQNMSIKAKWILYKLRKELLSHRDFYTQEGKKLLEECKAFYDADRKTFNFNTQEQLLKYTSKQKELDELEIEINFQKETLKMSEIPSITISQIEQLEEFIEFEPE